MNSTRWPATICFMNASRASFSALTRMTRPPGRSRIDPSPWKNTADAPSSVYWTSASCLRKWSNTFLTRISGLAIATSASACSGQRALEDSACMTYLRRTCGTVHHDVQATARAALDAGFHPVDGGKDRWGKRLVRRPFGDHFTAIEHNEVIRPPGG